jgi:hypothetical protein
MRLSALQTAIRAWLQLRLPPLTYETYEPNLEQVRALVPPPDKILYTREGGAVLASVWQTIFLQVRLTDREYQTLDQNKVGGIYQGIAMELALRGQRMADLESLEVLAVEGPIGVSPADDKKGGTILTFKWGVLIRYYASPERPFDIELGGPFGPGDRDPFTPTEVRFALHNSPLSSEDFITDSTLDYDFTTNGQ